MDTTLTKSGKTPNEKNSVTGRIFFLDLGGGRVLSANPDGSDLKTIVVEGRKFPDGLVVDIAAGHLYWTNMGNFKENDGSILRSDLDGKNVTTIVPPGGVFTPKQLQIESGQALLVRPGRYAFDASQSRWLEHRDPRRHEQGRSPAGSGCEEVVQGNRRRLGDGKFYWTQKGESKSGTGQILRANIENPQSETPANRQDIELLYDGLTYAV